MKNLTETQTEILRNLETEFLKLNTPIVKSSFNLIDLSLMNESINEEMKEKEQLRLAGLSIIDNSEEILRTYYEAIKKDLESTTLKVEYYTGSEKKHSKIIIRASFIKRSNTMAERLEIGLDLVSSCKMFNTNKHFYTSSVVFQSCYHNRFYNDTNIEDVFKDHKFTTKLQDLLKEEHENSNK
jgi:hypothetical protein